MLILKLLQNALYLDQSAPAQRPKCFKTYATKKLELFQNISNLAKLPFVRYALQSKVSMSTTTSRWFQYSKCDPMLTTKILLLIRVILKSFQKKKEDSSLYHASLFGHSLLHFVMLLLTYSAPKTRILSSTTHSPRFGDKN